MLNVNAYSELALLLFSIFILFIILFYLNYKKARLNQLFYRNNLSHIVNLLSSGDYSLAVMESDKLLDKALIESKVSGLTMGERLKHIKNLGLNINDVWWVHKLRNRVAHEIGYNVPPTNAYKAVKIVKTALKKLKAPIFQYQTQPLK